MNCSAMWSEEDYHLMDNHQPAFFPSGAHSPQIQPSRVAVERRVYAPPKLTALGSESQSAASHGSTAIPHMFEAQRTPKPSPRQLSPVTEKIQYQYEYPLAVPIAQAIPRTPPCSIPGYYPAKASHEEPGVAEMLLGCGILLALAVTVITVLFFLAT
jgi:hypothetical protein